MELKERGGGWMGIHFYFSCSVGFSRSGNRGKGWVDQFNH